jgi:hypothetical protein
MGVSPIDGSRFGQDKDGSTMKQGVLYLLETATTSEQLYSFDVCKFISGTGERMGGKRRGKVGNIHAFQASFSAI